MCTVKCCNCKLKKAVIKTVSHVTGFVITSVAYIVRVSLRQVLLPINFPNTNYFSCMKRSGSVVKEASPYFIPSPGLVMGCDIL